MGDQDGSEGEGVCGNLRVEGAQIFSERLLPNAKMTVGLCGHLVPAVDRDAGEEQINGSPALGSCSDLFQAVEDLAKGDGGKCQPPRPGENVSFRVGRELPATFPSRYS